MESLNNMMNYGGDGDVGEGNINGAGVTHHLAGGGSSGGAVDAASGWDISGLREDIQIHMGRSGSA